MTPPQKDEMNESLANEIIEHQLRFEQLPFILGGKNDGRSKWYKRSYALIGKDTHWDQEVCRASGFLAGVASERAKAEKVVNAAIAYMNADTTKSDEVTILRAKFWEANLDYKASGNADSEEGGK